MRNKTQQERDTRKAQRKAEKKKQKQNTRAQRVLTSMTKHIGTISDPRRGYGNLRHKMVDILVIALCSMLSGLSTFIDMEEFGRARIDWLRARLGLELPNGIPDADTIRRLLESVNPEEMGKALRGWLREQFGVPENGRQVTAVDGKTIRGSKSKEKRARHVLSAFVAEYEVTLGEIIVDEKSNEISAGTAEDD